MDPLEDKVRTLAVLDKPEQLKNDRSSHWPPPAEDKVFTGLVSPRPWVLPCEPMLENSPVLRKPWCPVSPIRSGKRLLESRAIFVPE
jgi:hypothetical protein